MVSRRHKWTLLATCLCVGGEPSDIYGKSVDGEETAFALVSEEHFGLQPKVTPVSKRQTCMQVDRLQSDCLADKLTCTTF